MKQLLPCTDKKVWDDFARSSTQGNIFCNTVFLDSLGEEYELLFVEESGGVQVGTVVLKKDGQPIRAPYPFTMYQGVLFDAAIQTMPHHKRLKRCMELLDFLLVNLEQRYNRMSWCLHPTFDDLRSFQWFHYHAPERGQFKIDLRYTGRLDLLSIKSFEDCLASVRSVRRQEYRYACQDGLTAEVSTDVDILDRLHQLTFARQGIERPSEEGRLLRSISQAALARGFGRLLVCKDSHGTALSATLFLQDAHCGYYLFGANHPDARKSGSGTFLLLESIRHCMERGLAWVDFVGINSPNRGDFKTSFNATPVPYFIVTWEKPQPI